MMEQKQEVITPDQARYMRQYEEQLQRWGRNQKAEKSGASLLAAIAAPLWVISYFASGALGAVNQPMWFVAFALVTFVGALGCSVTAIVFWVTRTMTIKPVREAHVPTQREFEE